MTRKRETASAKQGAASAKPKAKEAPKATSQARASSTKNRQNKGANDAVADVYDEEYGTAAKANAARQEEIAQVYDPDR